jgi:hypothetical protein
MFEIDANSRIGTGSIPNCSVCGEDYLIANTYRVYEVELFCANVLCPAFVKTFWVKKSDLEER